MRAKLTSFEELNQILSTEDYKGKVVVQCHGVFDLLHLGHIRYFESAKRHGDVLVVSLTADEYVNKGPGRPVFNSAQRAAMLTAIEVVDFVVIDENLSAESAIRSIRPGIYVKGPDYGANHADATGNLAREKQALSDVGGTYVQTEDETFSSSTLINQHFPTADSRSLSWLKQFKCQFSKSQILQRLEDVKELRVLVLGEAVIDEYFSCEALGKSSKDPILAFREVSLERQLGGSLAVANNCRALGVQVTLATEIGAEPGLHDLVYTGLLEGIDTEIHVDANVETITKRRYLEESSTQRVFETYRMGLAHEYGGPKLVRHVRDLLNNEFDLILICDYGHGFFSEGLIAHISASGQTLAVNTQANAGNRGFNTVGKYPRADIICLNGGELALELRRQHLSLELHIPHLQSRMKCRSLLVTEGSAGVSISRPGIPLVRVPAFAPVVHDRVGAGDALFAVASLMEALGSAPEITGFWGNLAGAASVAQLGNREPIFSANLSRHGAAILS